MSQVTCSTYRAVAFVVAAMLTACAAPSGFQDSAEPQNNLLAATVTKQSTAATVYVQDWKGENTPIVTVFGNGGSLYLRTIKHGSWVAADHSGYVYIAHSPVTVYSDQGKTLVQKFSVQGGPAVLGRGREIVADGEGHFYVSCGNGRRICEYQIGKQGPIRQLIASGVVAATTDTSGNLYIVEGDGEVQVFGPTGTIAQRSITDGLDGPESVAVDSADTLYVGNTNAGANHIGTVVVYAPGTSTPSRTISEGITSPIVVHTDFRDNLVVLNGYNGYISSQADMVVYTPGSSSPAATITTGLDAPNEFAFDSSNNLYVANTGASNTDPGNVTVYAAGSYSLSRTVTQNINAPISIAVGP